jgi:hypothetical protein
VPGNVHTSGSACPPPNQNPNPFNGNNQPNQACPARPNGG